LRPPRRPASAGRPGRRRRLHPGPAVGRLPQAGTPAQTAQSRPPAAVPGLPHLIPAPPPSWRPRPAGRCLMTYYAPTPEALRLPAGPLLAAVDQAASDRGVSLSDLLGNTGQKTYTRVRQAGAATLAQVEDTCDRLGCHPYQLY